MARIARSYNTLFVDGKTMFASDTVRAFDNIYDAFNGQITTANFLAIDMNANTVIFSTSNFIGSSVSAVIDEVKNMNYHNFHFFPAQHHTMTCYKARGYIKNRMCYINDDIVISASLHVYSASVMATSAYVVCIGYPNGVDITASDIYYLDYSNITASLAWNDTYQGYYPSYYSGNRRALYWVVQDYSASARISDREFLDPPWEDHRRLLTAQEASAIGFTGVGVTYSTKFSLDSVTRFYDGVDRGYSYWLRGTNGGVTNNEGTYGVNTNINNPDSFSLRPVYGWTVSEFTMTSDNDPNAQFYLGETSMRNSANALLSNMWMEYPGQVMVNNTSTALCSGSWQMRLRKRETVYRFDYGYRG